MQPFEVKQFIDLIAEELGGDYLSAFKLLGLVVFIAEEGGEKLMSGKMISTRSYYRWIDIVQRAGWGDLLADARLRNVIQEYLWKRIVGLPIDQARDRVLRVVSDMVTETEVRPLPGISGQASASVKGLAVGREAKPSALDDGAYGDSLGKAAEPKIG